MDKTANQRGGYMRGKRSGCRHAGAHPAMKVGMREKIRRVAGGWAQKTRQGNDGRGRWTIASRAYKTGNGEKGALLLQGERDKKRV